MLSQDQGLECGGNLLMKMTLAAIFSNSQCYIHADLTWGSLTIAWGQKEETKKNTLKDTLSQSDNWQITTPSEEPKVTVR